MTRIVQIARAHRVIHTASSRSRVIHTANGDAGKTSRLTVAVLRCASVLRCNITVTATGIATTAAISTALVYKDIATAVATNRLSAPRTVAIAVGIVTASIIAVGVIATARLTESKTRSVLIAHIGISFLLVYLR